MEAGKKAIETVEVVEETIPFDNKEEIQNQIKTIRNEKCPDYAKSTIAKSVWENDKQKRIAELQKQL